MPPPVTLGCNSHPRLIRVFDVNIDRSLPGYTVEAILDTMFFYINRPKIPIFVNQIDSRKMNKFITTIQSTSSLNKKKLGLVLQN